MTSFRIYTLLLLLCCFVLAGCSNEGPDAKTAEETPQGSVAAGAGAGGQGVGMRGLAVRDAGAGNSAQRNVVQLKPIDLVIKPQEEVKITYFDVSDNGEVLVTTPGNDVVDVWDLRKRQVLGHFHASGDVKAVTAHSETGRVFAITKSCVIDIFDMKTGKRVKSLNCGGMGWNQQNFINYVLQKGPLKISRDGSMLAAVVDERVALWSLDSFNMIGVLKDPPGESDLRMSYYTIAFSQDGKWLFGSGRRQYIGTRFDAPITVWNAKTGELVRSFPGGTRESKSLVFNQDGTVIYGNTKADSPGWNVNTGDRVNMPYEYNADVVKAKYGMIGYIPTYTICHGTQQILFYQDDALHVADIQTRKTELFQRDEVKYLATRNTIGINGKWAGVVAGGTAYLVDLQAGRVVHAWRSDERVQGSHEPIANMVIGPQGDYVGLRRGEFNQKHVYLYNKSDWDTPIASIWIEGESCALLDDALVLTYSFQEGLALRTSGKPIEKQFLHPMLLQGWSKAPIAALSDGSKVYFGTDCQGPAPRTSDEIYRIPDSVRVWDTAKGTHEKILDTSRLQHLAVDDSGEFLSTAVGESVYIWRTVDNSLVNKIDVGSTVVASAINADEHVIYIAMCGKATGLQSYDVDSGKLYDTFKLQSSAPTGLALNIRTNVLYLAAGDSILAVDADGLNIVAEMRGLPDAFVVTTTGGYYAGSGLFRNYVFEHDAQSGLVPLRDHSEERFSIERVASALNPQKS